MNHLDVGWVLDDIQQSAIKMSSNMDGLSEPEHTIRKWLIIPPYLS